ncbi:MAG TPA: methylated-DNA--[protein]-cysteine S-methyltransferase [Stellaceae bacterium]|nr:methylated-DNA--[protein]-cysteine S-methyltransferase [Stellaceae bacterium]
MLCSMTVDSPVGRLAITADADAIVAIGWADYANGAATALLVEASRQLDVYFAGRLKQFELPLRPAGSPFEERVWRAMQQIPHGETRSYGELAMEVGSAPRAIGRACARNPIPIVIPCHRVLARGGLGGYSGGTGLETKRALLLLEGIAAPLMSPPARRANPGAAKSSPIGIAAAPRSFWPISDRPGRE